MGFGVSFYLLRLARMLEPCKKRAGRAVLRAPDQPVARYGGCPACGEFLCIAPSTASGDVRCPTCGRRFDRRTPLGPFVSESRAPDALYDKDLDG